VAEVPARIGVSIRTPLLGSVVEVDSSVCYPLASVYKVPLLATLFHKVSEGEISLGRRYPLREIDRALGSGDLQYFAAGTCITVRDLAYLMIVHSDNTATDMIHHLIGMDAPNDYMCELGLKSIDIHCPNREYFLLLLGYASRFKELSLAERVAVWRRLNRAERVKLYAEMRKEMAKISHATACRDALEAWGISGQKERRIDRIASEVMDNAGSPADISRLLELVHARAVARTDLTEIMIEIMVMCDSRERLPKKIPEGIKVANKTGGLPGTVNDCAIIFPKKKPPIFCTCLSRGVKHKEVKVVEEAISDIGLAAYNALGK